MVDMNTAKLAVWREIVDTPIWPGEPVGFMTHTPDRVQSAMTTAAHVALAATLGVDAITMASSDEPTPKVPYPPLRGWTHCVPCATCSALWAAPNSYPRQKHLTCWNKSTAALLKHCRPLPTAAISQRPFMRVTLAVWTTAYIPGELGVALSVP